MLNPAIFERWGTRTQCGISTLSPRLLLLRAAAAATREKKNKEQNTPEVQPVARGGEANGARLRGEERQKQKPTMPYTRLVEVGRVAMINYGKNYGKYDGTYYGK